MLRKSDDRTRTTFTRKNLNIVLFLFDRPKTCVIYGGETFGFEILVLDAQLADSNVQTQIYCYRYYQ